MGRIQGLSMGRGAPEVSHLFFADDSLLLLQMEDGVEEKVQTILDCYERALGQKINNDKSAIMFGRNAKWERRREISWLTIPNWEIKKTNISVCMGQSMEKGKWMEEKVANTSR